MFMNTKTQFLSREYGKILFTKSPDTPTGTATFQAAGPFGSIKLSETQVGDYVIWHSQYSLKKKLNLSFSTKEKNAPMLVCMLKCDGPVTVKAVKEELIRKNHYNIASTPRIQYELRSKEEYQMFGITFKPALLRDSRQAHPLLKAFIDNMTRKSAATLSPSHLPVSFEMLVLIRDLLNSYDGALRMWYLRAKIYNLLFIALERIISGDYAARNTSLKESDVKKVERAKEYLEESLFSYDKLTKMVDIKPHILKKGFREIYGTTVYKFGNAQRMKKARHLLVSTDKSILEVSRICGFKNQSNFSSAFKSHFGYTPLAAKNTA